MDKLTIKDVYYLAIDYYNHKISSPTVNSKEGSFEFVLYESFVFGMSIDERYGVFGAALSLSNKHISLKLLGEEIAINNDRNEILKSFKKIDTYCRLRLPDKFLEAYDKAYKE